MSEIQYKTIKAIQTGKHVLPFTEMEYRDLMQERYGVRSTKDLTEEQGRDLLDHFRTLGFGKKKRPYVRREPCRLCAPRPKVEGIPAGVIYPVSLGQLAVIDELQKAVKWAHPDGFRLWLMKYFHLDKIEWSPQASRVITALKGLLRSQKTGCACVWSKNAS